MKNKNTQTMNISLRLKSIKKINIRVLIPFIGLAFIIILFTIITSGRIVSIYNLRLVLEQSIVLIIACVGVTFVMSLGSLDFSQGSVLAICSVVAAIFAKQYAVTGFLAALAVGALIGATSGVLVSIVKIPSFIVTISMLFIFRGLTAFVTKDAPFPMPVTLAFLDNIEYKLPILAVILLLGFYMFNYMIFGKHCRAIGAGEMSAVFSGVNVKMVKIIAFTFAGLLAGLCGILSLIRTGVASPFTGTLFEIDVLTALVLGGMPINGGAKSKIQSAIIGSLMLSFLSNGLVILGVSASVLQFIKGIIFLGAVYVSIEREGLVVIK